MPNKSLVGRFFITIIASVLIYAGTIVYLSTQHSLGISQVLLLSITLVVVIMIAFYFHVFPLTQTLQALDNGVSAFKDNDFSITLQKQPFRELHGLVNIYNELATVLRAERMDIFQRELLLDSVIQSTPVSLVLTNSKGVIVYSNLSAKSLFQSKKTIEGLLLSDVVAQLSAPLRSATLQKFNGLVTDHNNDDAVTYNINCRQFMLNGRAHHLYLYKNMTNEMSRKESEMWKQVIRLISHELNNSLAPIASLTKSAKKIIKSPEHFEMLEEVLDTIGRRSSHLHDFISQYANFARLPLPECKPWPLVSFFNNISKLLEIPCEIKAQASHISFDAAQIEQVLINLVKNAKESGSAIEDIGINVTQEANVLVVSVFDRGSGLSEAQLQQAMLPFFSTKPNGMGIGLALCNEIVANHDGRLHLYNRDNGGLCVSFSLALDESDECEASLENP
ncbi:sensor histidine kinase [Thalassotalea fusca]